MYYMTLGTEHIVIWGQWTLGSVDGSTATFTLPGTYAAHSSYANPQVLGPAFANAATAYFFTTIAVPSDTKIYFGSAASAVFTPTAKTTGSNLWGNGQIIHIPPTIIRIQ
jgi:hypothetical protein